MKLLLTSTGLKNREIAECFLELLAKPVAQAKIIFVPTAARSEEELKYVKESKQELFELGFLEENIKIVTLDGPVTYSEVEDFDAIYICGGNTFYLMKKIRETGFGEIIKKMTALNRVYLGVSAGSIIAGSDISIADPFDENDSGIADFSGIGLAKIVVSPHYATGEEKIISNFENQLGITVTRITDNQAILINDSGMTVIE